MRTPLRSAVAASLALAASLPAGAQTAGREPAAGSETLGGTTFVDTENPVTASGVLRLWRAYATAGARAMLKVYRPEGERLVLVGTSPLVAVPAGEVTTFTCQVPVSRNDVIGCYCPDDTCVDRFADGLTLSAEGDAGTGSLDGFTSGVGSPAIWAGTSFTLDIPSTAATDLVLPVAARTPGAEGTQWSTSLELFNTATETTTVVLYFNLSDHDNTTPAASAQLELPARDVVVFDDLLAEAFELEQATGSVDIVASAPVIAHARVANVGSTVGTFGQLVPAVPARWAVGIDEAPGINPSADILYLFELREDDAFRTNVGIANTSGVELVVELEAYGDGTALGEPLTVTVPPFSHTQLNRLLATMDLPAGTTRARLNLHAAAGNPARFLAYASRVDNSSGDAVFLLGEREPTLP